MILIAFSVIIYLLTILGCYVVYGRWLAAAADSAGDLPVKAEIVRIVAAVGTPAIVVNTISMTAKVLGFLVML